MKRANDATIRILRLALLLWLVPVSAGADELNCGNPFVNHFGPFDYRTATPADKQLVESFHFKPETETETRSGTGAPAGDIGLRCVCSITRALTGDGAAGCARKTSTPKFSVFSVDCYSTGRWARRTITTSIWYMALPLWM